MGLPSTHRRAWHGNDAAGVRKLQVASLDALRASPYGARGTSTIPPTPTKMTDENTSANTTTAANDNAANFLRFMPPFIKDLHARGVGISLDAKTFELHLSGFYGNGDMRLIIRDDGGFTAVDKNGKQTPVSTFKDLVLLNFDWWQAANTRGRYMAPTRPWIDGFREHNLVKRCVIYVSRDNPSVEGEED